MDMTSNQTSPTFIFKWNLDWPNEKTLRNCDRESKVEFRGWVLAKGNLPVRLVLRQNGVNQFYDLNESRPDVIRKFLNLSEKNHSKEMCGFRHSIALSGNFDLGFEKNKEQIQWIRSFDFLEKNEIKKLQINPEIEIFEDRAKELALYWNISEQEVKNIYEEFNIKKSQTPPEFVSDTLETIIDSYLDEQRLRGNLSRMMLKYTRYNTALNLVKCVNSLIHPKMRSQTKVLDYGCGVADYALVFANNGYSPAICDLSGGKIEFAEFRFKIRNLQVSSYPVTKEVEYPKLEPVDLIVTSELLEHVRSPLECLQNMHSCLNDGGYLWFSDFPMKPKTVGGDHLQSAADERLKCVDFIRQNFTPVDNSFVKNFYKKIHGRSRNSEFGKMAYQLCKGKGLEIGALHQPFDLDACVIYADRFKTSELQDLYKNDPRGKYIQQVQVVSDKNKYDFFDDNSFNFVISSHVLEHTFNPGRVLEEWIRIVKQGGIVYFVIPDKRYTFDRNRELTSVKLLIDKFDNNTNTADYETYYDAMVNAEPALRVLDEAGKKERVKKAFEKQSSIHVHTFTAESTQEFMTALASKIGFEVVYSSSQGMHIHFALKKNHNKQ
ncbi:methyltransferase domain-containing protein [Okeania sp. SIO1I7]|uniref:class I SAM-dependent methyltransferase n=1 Tax=Okeania sp. SIO1I7 TaxID=2607772 RepID=UPI0025F97571|nr:methyltransferase domain-containing protein [Okeania sp. SIO1I7]